MSEISLFLELHQKGWLHDFCDSGACLVAASPVHLSRMQESFRWEIKELHTYLRSNVLIVRKSESFEPECWVRWDYRGYRKAFIDFLGFYYPKINLKLDDAHHIDHLEPKFRFKKGDVYFVRLHLIDRKTNTHYGSGFEKSFYASERSRELPVALHATPIIHAKAMCIKLPGKQAGKAAWENWARNQASAFCSTTGEHEGLVYLSFLKMLQLGYTSHYSGSPKPYSNAEMLGVFKPH